MSDIRSINNIWLDSHICLRDYLYIPLDKDSPHLNSQLHPTNEVISRKQLLALRKMSKSVSVDQQLTASQTLVPTSDESLSTSADSNTCGLDTSGSLRVQMNTDVQMKDYFSKFDSSLEKIKNNIEKLEKNSA